MPTTLAERMRKQKQVEARVAEKRAILNIQVRKAETRKNIGQGKLAEDADLLPLIEDPRWLELSPTERQGVVRYIQAGIREAKTIRAWVKAEPPPAEQPSVTLPTLVAAPAAAE